MQIVWLLLNHSIGHKKRTQPMRKIMKSYGVQKNRETLVIQVSCAVIRIGSITSLFQPKKWGYKAPCVGCGEARTASVEKLRE